LVATKFAMELVSLDVIARFEAAATSIRSSAIRGSRTIFVVSDKGVGAGAATENFLPGEYSKKLPVLSLLFVLFWDH
jgi:hypothetical protein